MVTRTAMNPMSSSGDGVSDGSRSKLREDYDDALVLATAMASGGTDSGDASEAQERSPPGGAHYQMNFGDFDQQLNDRDDSSSTDQHQLAYLDPPPFPPSPLMTPPTCSYDTTATEVARRAYVASSTASSKRLSSGSQSSSVAAGVPHVYHDYSQIPEDNSYIRKKTGGVTQPFPEKLQEMLRAVEETGFSSIVTWLPHGRAFVVRQPTEFTGIIMPKYFKQTKLTSFQRQLNLYGFRRITQGTDAGAYYHEMFLKDRPGLCQRMARQKVKGTGHKQPADAKTEPNFYEMRPTESAAPLRVPPLHNFGAIEQLLPPHFQRHEQLQPPPDTAAPIVHVPSLVGAPAIRTVVDEFSSPWSFPPPPPGSVLDSPASPGLHGAAHLLQGIASGYSSSLRIPTDNALGSPAAAAGLVNKDGEGEKNASEPPRQKRPASFLQPRLSSPFNEK